MSAAPTLLLAVALVVPPRGPSEDLGSHLVQPLYLGEEPPECRSARRLLLRHGEGERTRAEALRLAESLVAELRAGTDFEELVERVSEGPRAHRGGVLGTFPPGILRPALEEFLFAAEPGDVSDPLDGPAGVEIVQRIPRWAGCRQILIRGGGEEARARALDVLERARAGEDFADLARRFSEDEANAARGGAVAVFERGAHDAFLKAATFRVAVGEVFGPLESPLGFHVGKRVAPNELDPSLRETNWVRARSILVAHSEAPGPVALTEREPAEARRLAEELHGRISAGEDMARLARRFDDDRDGAARAGDLGWLYRSNPAMEAVLDRLFVVEPGTLLEPLPVRAGWLLLRRER